MVRGQAFWYRHQLRAVGPDDGAASIRRPGKSFAQHRGVERHLRADRPVGVARSAGDRPVGLDSRRPARRSADRQPVDPADERSPREACDRPGDRHLGPRARRRTPRRSRGSSSTRERRGGHLRPAAARQVHSGASMLIARPSPRARVRGDVRQQLEQPVDRSPRRTVRMPPRRSGDGSPPRHGRRDPTARHAYAASRRSRRARAQPGRGPVRGRLFRRHVRARPCPIVAEVVPPDGVARPRRSAPCRASARRRPSRTSSPREACRRSGSRQM